MPRRRSWIAAFAAVTVLVLSVPGRAEEATVRIGQGVATLSFLPLVAARAMDSFKDQQLHAEFASIRGGDPATLAALDSGDIDFAATGSDTALEAIGKGQPFQIIYSLMSQVTLEMVVSKDLFERAHVNIAAPLKQRIATLKGMTIGVSAIGGAQDRAVRWLVAQGGLDPQHDLKIAMVGAPPAIQAALEHQQVDGFILSPPEGELAEAGATGHVLIRLGVEFPDLRSLPYLVLVAKTPMSAAQRALAIKTARALQAASQAVLKDTGAAATIIQGAFYPKLDPKVIAAGIDAMRGGIAGDGSMNESEIEHLLQFTSASGGTVGALDARKGRTQFWTEEIVDAARGGAHP
jgi:ABC-type nitrate/sulfonate/bicarbonate transport system substrate-binding protein